MRIYRFFAALLGLGLFVSGVRADSVQFNTVTNGGTIIQPLLNGSAMSGWGIIGQYNWTVEQNGSALGPNGSHFFTFCIDIPQDIAFNGTYDYTLTNPANAPKPNSTYMNGPMGADNAAALGRLWAADIGNVLNATSVANELEASAAFQLAVWKITYNHAPDNLNTNDALDGLTIQLYTADPTLQNQINTDAFNWASAALNSSGTGTPLVALSSLTAQDQITMAPTPAAVFAGLVLMAGIFAVRLRRPAVDRLTQLKVSDTDQTPLIRSLSSIRILSLGNAVQIKEKSPAMTGDLVTNFRWCARSNQPRTSRPLASLPAVSPS